MPRSKASQAVLRRELADARLELLACQLPLTVLDAMLGHPRAQQALIQLQATLRRVESRLEALTARLALTS